MKITKISPRTGKRNTRDIDVTHQQLYEINLNQKNIADIVPHLSLDDREFLMTGLTPQDWRDIFPPEER